MRLIVFLLAVLLMPCGAHAQWRSTSTFDAAPGSLVASLEGVRLDTASNGSASPETRFLLRSGAGLGGWVVGGILGAALGYGAFPSCPGGGGCEDPGLEGILAGILVGGPLGTALFAALPGLADGCSYGNRFTRGLLGSAAASALGATLTVITGNPLPLPILTVVGGSTGTLFCRAPLNSEP